jgi:hypothetical protein
MRPNLLCAACLALFCWTVSADAQQASGPGEVVRPKAAKAPEGVTVIGCVLPEARPNAFRLILSAGDKDKAAPKLPKGLKAGSSLELVARGETNLQPLANQKIEVTGKLTNGNRRLEVVDARPIGTCDPTTPSEV